MSRQSQRQMLPPRSVWPVFQPRCRFCKFALEHAEMASLIEYQILFEKITYNEALSLLRKDYDFRLNESSLRTHMKKHMPTEVTIIENTFEASINRIRSVADLTAHNLMILDALKRVGVYNITVGTYDVTPATLLRVIEIQQRMTAGDRIVIESGDRRPLLPAEAMKDMVQVMYDFVPPERRQAMAEHVSEVLEPKWREMAKEAILASKKLSLAS